ncbi:hypothetical protein [Neptunicoccus sediminis]|uniref:hypothetical protein n=1 Tax=Neptunicoccus sediminis TaxID=1892596 RepID=UPI000846227F|nr:hypothetical protein [Neptunicoccus sediminis]
MSFRELNYRFLAPGAQTLMILGIIALCQPWSEFFHRYGLTMTLFGLIAFLVTSKISPDAPIQDDFVGESADVLELHGDEPDDVREKGTYKDGGIV